MRSLLARELLSRLPEREELTSLELPLAIPAHAAIPRVGMQSRPAPVVQFSDRPSQEPDLATCQTEQVRVSGKR